MKAVLALAALLGTAAALVGVYHGVEPVKPAWSAWADTVGQGATCNFDEPIYAEFFTGTATNAQYKVELRLPPGPTGTVVAEGYGYEGGSHVWGNPGETRDTPLFTSGKPGTLPYLRPASDTHTTRQLIRSHLRDAQSRAVAGGVYFCQVENGKERQQKKVVLTE